jgi:hypothetical protein
MPTITFEPHTDQRAVVRVDEPGGGYRAWLLGHADGGAPGLAATDDVEAGNGDAVYLRWSGRTAHEPPYALAVGPIDRWGRWRGTWLNGVDVTDAIADGDTLEFADVDHDLGPVPGDPDERPAAPGHATQATGDRRLTLALPRPGHDPPAQALLYQLSRQYDVDLRGAAIAGVTGELFVDLENVPDAAIDALDDG